MGDAQHNTMTRGAINWLLSKLKNHTHNMISGLGRLTNANRVGKKNNSLEIFMVDNDTVTGKPPRDSNVLQTNCDKTEFISQLALGINGDPHAYLRCLDNGTWIAWRTLLDSANWNSYAGAKPVYTFTSSGPDGLCETIRFPDTKVQISCAWKGIHTEIASAWGSGYINADRISVGDWNQAFSDSSKLVSVATVTPETSGTDCWVSTVTGANIKSAGQYHLVRQTAANEKQTFYVNVIAIGTYE